LEQQVARAGKETSAEPPRSLRGEHESSGDLPWRKVASCLSSVLHSAFLPQFSTEATGARQRPRSRIAGRWLVKQVIDSERRRKHRSCNVENSGVELDTTHKRWREDASVELRGAHAAGHPWKRLNGASVEVTVQQTDRIPHGGAAWRRRGGALDAPWRLRTSE